MPMWLRFSNSRAWSGLALAMMGLALSGCGSDDFVPPPPAELRGVGGGTATGPATTAPAAVTRDLVGSATTGVKSIELVLGGGRDPVEIESEKSAARMQAGMDKARIKITVVGEERADQGPQPASFKDEATLVRDAIARHPQALIVEPDDPENHELAKAIKEARAAKVPVVLLGRPLADSAGNSGSAAGAPVLVRPEPFAPSAKQLVAAAIRNVKNAKLDPQGGAILLINTAADPFVPDRVAALREALKAAGISSVDEVRFAADSAVGQRALTERLKADPKPTMVFTVDFMSTTACNGAVGDLVPDRPFIQVGYTSDDNNVRMARAGEFAALGQYIPNRLTRKAISTAVALALRQEVHGPVEIPVVVQESPPNAGLARYQSRHRAKMGRGE